jgi:hypothetical protein
MTRWYTVVVMYTPLSWRIALLIAQRRAFRPSLRDTPAAGAKSRRNCCGSAAFFARRLREWWSVIDETGSPSRNSAGIALERSEASLS